MADNNSREDKKTVVAFIVGLLIGGLLVWAFQGPATDTPKTEKKEVSTEKKDDKATTTKDSTAKEDDKKPDTESSSATPVIQIGEGSVTVGENITGNRVPLAKATYPVSEGWVGVRDYQDERLGGLLGVVRFSENQGLVPTEIVLQRPMRAGAQYAIVMYTESGDKQFNLASDVQIDKVFATFTAK